MALSNTTHSASKIKMLMEESEHQIETYRFLLSGEEELTLHQSLDKLKGLVPDRSHVRLAFSMSEDGWMRGVLEVQNLDHYFEAFAHHDDPVALYQILEADVLEQVSRWKEEHFNKSATKH